MFTYPTVRRDISIKDDYHGTEVADPYRWLEDPDSEETKEFVDAQNRITNNYIESLNFREDLRKHLTELWNYPKLSQYYKHGGKYYQYRNSGLQNQNVIFVQDSLDSKGKVFFNPNRLSEDGTISLTNIKFTENGKTVAYGLSAGGSDWTEIHFRDTETMKDYPEVLKKVKFTKFAWLHNHFGFFYSAYLDQEGKVDGSETSANINQKLYFHKLGKHQSEDVAVVSFKDPLIILGATISDCGQYLIVTAHKDVKDNLVYFCDLKGIGKINKPLPLTPVVSEFNAVYEYITNNGSSFLFRSNRNAKNYRVIVIDFEDPDEKNWRVLIPEHSKDVLEDCSPINTNLLNLIYLRDVKHAMQLNSMDSGEKIHELPLDIGTITGISGKRYDNEMFYGFTSFLTPMTVYRVDFSKCDINPEVVCESKVVGLDPDLFETHQVFYNSKDGTEIPMFLLYKKDFVKDGSKPCLLYGYGGFNISITSGFSIPRLLFLTKFDGMFAIPNIRGGGEYGDKWHDGGRFENKQNSFDDFQHAAKFLIEEKYTSAEKITIQGGSNGGLLVAACINQAPELFGAAICHVGVLDMLRFHKFTIGYAWKSDYGSSESPDMFKYLFKYSPLHNVTVPKENGQYPATLLLTADHDDRVVPLHSFKYISELQNKVGSLPTQRNPLMIRIETKAGHGGGKPTTKLIDETVDVFCFVAKALVLKYNK